MSKSCGYTTAYFIISSSASAEEKIPLFFNKAILSNSKKVNSLNTTVLPF